MTFNRLVFFHRRFSMGLGDMAARAALLDIYSRLGSCLITGWRMYTLRYAFGDDVRLTRVSLVRAHKSTQFAISTSAQCPLIFADGPAS